MIAELHLGARLAGAGAAAGAGRLRSVLVAIAAAVGTALMLAVVAIARSELIQSGDSSALQDGTWQLLTTIVAMVALPVLVLAATAGRLAASLRDRRLANLRLLGMTTFQTRLVAAVGTGLAAAVGAVAGLVLFLAIRPLLAWWRPAGRPWTYDTLTPGVIGYIVIVLMVPLAVTLVSASARSGRHQQSLAQSRQADTRGPSWWRLVPLVVGIGLAVYLIRSAQKGSPVPNVIPLMFTAITLLGLGVVLVVPSLVRLIANVLVRCRNHPAMLIAGRRLQTQPAAASRIVAGLLIGLFVVTGSQTIVSTFETTPQYQAAALAETVGQSAIVNVAPADAESTVRAFENAPWVRTAAAFPVMAEACQDDLDCWTTNAIVGTCAGLRELFGPLPDCRDDRAAWITASGSTRGAGATLAYVPAATGGGAAADDPERSTEQPQASVTIPMPTYTLNHVVSTGLAWQITVFLPRSISGVAEASRSALVDVVVVANPGVDIATGISDVEWSGGNLGFLVTDTSAKHTAQGLRALVWSVAIIVLAVGLLGFAIGAVDRAVSRRAELISLQLVGVGPGMLRRTQWIEAAMPLGVGIVLAIGAGSLAGATYLAFGGVAQFMPWSEIGTLAGVSVIAAVLVAGLTVISSSPRIRPELIRTE